MAVTKEQREEFIKELYMYEKTIDKTSFDVYFFGSWSSYAHPVTLQNPMSYPETQSKDRKVYYEAFYSNTSKKQLFVRLEKIELVQTPSPLRYKPQKEGVHYYLKKSSHSDEHSFGSGADTPKTDEEELNEVELKDTMRAATYYRVVFDNHGEAIERTKVTKEAMYSFDYKYSEDGALKEVVMNNREYSAPKTITY